MRSSKTREKYEIFKIITRSRIYIIFWLPNLKHLEYDILIKVYFNSNYKIKHYTDNTITVVEWLAIIYII